MAFIKKLAILSVFFGIASTTAQTDSTTTKKTDTTVTYEKRIYTTASIQGAGDISVDGVLDEPAWDRVEWSSDYVEFEPDVGTAPTEQTKMKIAYDDKNLYVAFKCYHANPATIEKRMGRRDDFPGDWVEINIDSYDDDRSGFSFTASASGVKGDEFISNNGNFDDSWNPIWYLSTAIDDDGWTAEIRIPLSQLRFGNDEEQVWGIQSTRRYFNNEERSLWQPVPANPPGWVSEFGQLRGIKGIRPQKQLEIQPYVVAQLDTFEEEVGNPFRDGSDAKLTGGLDAKIGITNDLTLDLTVNPDFGQVDADPGAIALDGFEIFFQERRPFFVENKNVFDFRVGGGADNLFFSRRIGRTPQGYTTANNSLGEFEDIPNNTTILGAAKFSGKTKDGLSVGALQSVTAKEYGKIELDTRQSVLDGLEEVGEEREEIVEPLTSYSVVRLQQDFNENNSYIGGIATYTYRDLEGNLDFLHKNALSGGVDARHNWKDRKYYATGKFTFSNVKGSEEAIEITQNRLTHLFQRVDASHLEVDPTRTSLSGTGGSFEVGRGSGDWRYNFGGNFRSPELELNDLGFLRQADQIRQYTNVRRFWNKPTSWFRQANVGVNQFSEFDFEGNYNRIQYEIQGYVNWKNNWWSEMGVGHKPRIYSNTVLRGGPRWRWNDENFVFLFSGMDGRKKFNMHAGYVYSSATQNNFSFQRYVLRFFYQPLNTLSLSLINEYEVNPNKTQFFPEAQGATFNGQPRYILGGIDNESLSMTFRANFNINPNLTIQYYGQPFFFKAKYSDFNYVNDPTASNLNDRVSWFDEEQISFSDGIYSVDEDKDGTADYSWDDPDFNYVQFRSNMVVRWEYIPGSELFFVWSQGIEGISDIDNGLFDAGDDIVFGRQIRNTFLVKWTYRFVL